MELFPTHIESKLGFDKVKTLVESFCQSDLGKVRINQIQVSDDYHTIDHLLTLTLEQKSQISASAPFPELRAYRIMEELGKAKVAGYYLPAEVLFQLKLNLELARDCANFYKNNRSAYPAWSKISEAIEPSKELITRFNQIFDNKGGVKDGASSSLKKIRQEIRGKEGRARKALESVLRHLTDKGYTDKDSSLTIKDGRLVVPLMAEHKRHVKGLIIDESTTGKTVFMEPIEVFNENNEIRELRFAEKREVIGILTEVTARVAIKLNQLSMVESYLADLDFSRAKAKLAHQLKACKPNFSNSSVVKLQNARHPILVKTNQQLNLPVVPLDIEINSEQRVIVISGPNAGGKSVCLKTVGLLQMMLQSGMLVPVDQGSTMGCYKKLFIDIGDEQSIESDLSTYSSHLKNMKYFLEHSDPHTLFLIDEFGTGTEPQFGGAIAESILSLLLTKGSQGLVTTHYGNLKKYAEEADNVVNAAMRFDLKKLVPQYKLEIGRPGSSFALEIASNIGIPPLVVQSAKLKIGSDPVAFETLVSELELEKQKLEQSNRENRTLNESLDQERAQYEQLLAELKKAQKDIINQAKMEAQDLLAEANQKIEATIRSIQESKARKSTTQTVRKQLDVFKKKNRPDPVQNIDQLKIVPGPIKSGDLVRVKKTMAQGEVLKITGKSAEIRMGSLKSKVSLNRLVKVGRAKTIETNTTKSNFDIHKKRAQYSSQLDIRGFRAEEALKAVTDFIDEGALLGMTELRILHGKGDGILRSVIRKQLQEDPVVQSIGDEHIERGGSGVTLVTLK